MDSIPSVEENIENLGLTMLRLIVNGTSLIHSFSEFDEWEKIEIQTKHSKVIIKKFGATEYKIKKENLTLYFNIDELKRIFR